MRYATIVRSSIAFEVEELVVRERERSLDQALDVESPFVDEDAWLHERCVDNVVILVRGDPRRDAGKRIDRRIRSRDIHAGTQAARGRGDVAEPTRANGGDPRERKRHDRD